MVQKFIKITDLIRILLKAIIKVLIISKHKIKDLYKTKWNKSKN